MAESNISREEPAQQKRFSSAGIALTLLLAINLFNFMDRQLLAAVEPQIAEEYLEIDGVAVPDAEFWSGMLAFAFLATYMFIAPVFGWLADRSSRWLIIGFGVIFWSLAIFLSGLPWVGILAGNLALAYWILFLMRCLVGVGEGAYGPVAPTMIADMYPIAQRGKVMAMFYMAIPVGAAIGFGVAGVVTKVLDWSWHWAFYVVVPPGILLGILCFFMREPPRGQPSETVVTANKAAAKWDDYVALLRIPSYRLNMIGMTCLMFAIGALNYWLPRYLKIEQVEFAFGLDALTFLGVLLALGGFSATFLGGMAGDALKPYVSGSYFLVSGLAMLIGFPMVLLAIYMPFPWAWIFIFLAIFCLFFNTAPTNTINANVTRPTVRATAFAVNILVTHLLGDAISPSIVGLISRRTAESNAAEPNLAVGFMVISLSMLVGGVFWIWGSFYLHRDTELAEAST